MNKNQKGVIDPIFVIAIILIIAVGGLLYWRINSSDIKNNESVANSEQAEYQSNEDDIDEKYEEENQDTVTYPEEEQTAEAKVVAHSVPVPDSCDGYVHDSSGPKAMNYQQVSKEFTGEWQGCMSSKWAPDFLVSIDFRDDGTYNSNCLICPEGATSDSAMYWGSDGYHKKKTYSLDNYLSNNKTEGQITFYFANGGGSTNPGFIRDLVITGNTMSFKAYKGGNGPLEYNLVRVNQ